MADYCSICGKKVGLLSFKYKSEDGYVMCVSCLKEYKMKQEGLKKQKPKNKEIMKELIFNYLTDKDPEILILIRRVCCEAFWTGSFLNLSKRIRKYRHLEYKPQAVNHVVLKKAIKERPECVDYIQNLTNSFETPYIEKSQDFIRACRSEYQDAVNYGESSKESGLSSSELDEIAKGIKMWEIILNFLDDLEKMGGLFKKKGIETTSFEMLSIFFEVIRQTTNKEQNMPEQEQDELLNECHEIISTNYFETLSTFRKRCYLWREKAEFEKRCREKAEFESKQRKKGFVKFVGNDRKERWGTPEQAKRWKEIEVGLSNNFSDYTPQEFEVRIGELFKGMGYDVEVTPPTKDYGIDIVAKKDGDTLAIQVKKYAAGNNVGAKDVQQTLGAMWKVKADQSILITTSGFSVYATEQAKEAPIELWDKEILHELVRKYMVEE